MEGNELVEVAEGYSKDIFQGLLRKYQSQTSLNTNSNQYFSQENNLGGIDMEEYRILKAKKRTVGMQIKNLSSQIENVAKTESLAQAKYNGAYSETQTLLSEEEQLRRKVEEMRAQLAAYEEETR